MPIVVDVNEARRGRKVIEVEDYTQTENADDQYYATFYMGAPPDTAGSTDGASADKSLPQAYLVEQPPHATVPPHFHDTDQFQVFVHGSASFGKTPVRPLSVHYAGGHTPYGPIVTEDEGAHYFTLRAHWDSGGKPMPQSRDLLIRGRQCHRFAENIGPNPGIGPREDVLPFEDDGLGAALYSLRAGDGATVDLPVAGGGQYALVVAGTARCEGTELARHSCLFRFANESPLSLTAGAEGASVLVLQFPVSSEPSPAHA